MEIRDIRVVIAIPYYNGSKFLNAVLKSVIQQTYKVRKIIISDDASTDNINETLNEVREIYCSLEIECYRNDTNIGYAANWNKCLKYCDERFLVLLHQDDLLRENAIRTQLKHFQLRPDLALVGGQEDSINEEGDVIYHNASINSRIFEKGQIFEFIQYTGSYIPCSSIMFDMTKIRQVGFFDESYLATDELFWPKVLHQFPIAVLGESLIYRRKHPNQAEIFDFKNRPSEIIGWSKEFEKIINYEKHEVKRKKLDLLIKNKVAYALAGNIFKSTILYHRAYKLSFYYLFQGIKVYPKLLLQKRFWRTMIKTLLKLFKQIIQIK